MKRVSTSFAQKRIVDSIMEVQNHKTAKQYFDFACKDEAVKDSHDRAVEATLLSNFQKICDSELGQQLITTHDYGPYVPEIWPVITAWYPEFPLKDLVSVQDMNMPLAYLLLSRLYAGTDKAPTVAGDMVETPLGMRRIRGSYPTGEIYGEQVPAEQVQVGGNKTQILLAYAHLNVAADYLSKILIKVGTETFKATSVAAGIISIENTDGSKTGSIDQAAGIVTIDAEISGNVVCNYVWDVEYADDTNIPQVKEDIEMIPIEAKPRAIAMKWTIFSEYVKKSQFGIDIRTENTKRILDLIYQFQVRYVLDDLYDYAGGTTFTLKIPTTQTMAVEVKSQEVMRQLKQQATVIELASGRIEGNRIVCGKNFKSYVESLPTTLFTPTTQPNAFSGPREIGKYGTFTVYYDPYREDDEAMMTYRGTEWYDATYYVGMYMPITPTDIISIGVDVRSAFCEMSAYFYHKKNCVIPFTVEFTAQ